MPKSDKTPFAQTMFNHWLNQQCHLFNSASIRYTKALEEQSAFSQAQIAKVFNLSQDVQNAFLSSPISAPKVLADDAFAYITDRSQRTWLTLDTLHRAAVQTEQHAQQGAMPFLHYDYECILDGDTLSPPSNYCLLKIMPQPDHEIDEQKRPYIIIDPRAGHGPGIGGFKQDSQVGVALAKGHPVYFVAFKTQPVANQTISNVIQCEAQFVKKVQSLHPTSLKPVIVGNCQGGWATAILAATHPELAGPIVLNGAPMAYWSGKIGQDPMRYSGGIMGGVFPAMLSSDLNGGEFDGANLVFNFESQNPARTWFKKYYDLFVTVDDSADKFIEFEKWWSTFYFMTDNEIQWIVENLFIGNKLVKNQAYLDEDTPVNLKLIRSPIILFASHGDNITPPGQALNWIMDVYTDEQEIKLAGQRIIYLIHEDIGHLGIFVSSKVAQKEHKNLVSALEVIEAFPPGLYQMHIDSLTETDGERAYEVSFSESTFAELLLETGDRTEEIAFEGVAQFSDAQKSMYELTLRPLIKSLATYVHHEYRKKLHPARLARHSVTLPFFSSTLFTQNVSQARANRQPLSTQNALLQLEEVWVSSTENIIDQCVQVKEAAIESAFFHLWSSPCVIELAKLAQNDGQAHAPQGFPNTVLHALTHAESGGAIAGFIRVLLLSYKLNDGLTLEHVARCSKLLLSASPFCELDAEVRNKLLLQQKILVDLDLNHAIMTLPKLLVLDIQRKQALEHIQYIMGGADRRKLQQNEQWRDLIAILEDEHGDDASVHLA